MNGYQILKFFECGHPICKAVASSYGLEIPMKDSL